MQDECPVYVPLICMLSGTKIRNPVRAPGSNTYVCSDKESFALSGRYMCPVTGVYCLVTELQRDEDLTRPHNPDPDPDLVTDLPEPNPDPDPDPNSILNPMQV